MPSQPSYDYQNFFEKGAASLFEYLPRATNIGTNQILKLRKQPSNLFFIFAILSSLLTINLSNTAYAAERVWTAGTATEDNHWKSVAYGNGVWIAVSINRTNVSQIMRSTDNGVNWTAATGPGATGNTFFMSAAYGGNNTWIAASQHGPVVKSTDNGSSWSIIDLTASGGNKEWLAVAYGNGVWVVTSKQTDVIVSSDGDLWHRRSQPAWVNGYEFRSLAYGTATGNTPRWVAVNQSHDCNCLTSRVMTSDDNGTTWTYRTAAQDYKWESVTYGDGVWVAVSSSGTGNRVMTSPDGINWTSRNSIGDFEWVSVSYGVEEDGTKRWVAVSQETFRASMTSTDKGVTWSSQTIPEPSSAVTWQGLGYGNGIWVAVGASGVMRLVAALAAPAFTLSSTTETRTVNTAATGFTINSTGGAIASFAINATPPGMSFNTTTGALTGTPNTVAAATNYTITATNASGNATQTFTLTVTSVVYTVGQTGPGGGKVFYVAPTGTTFACGPTLATTCTYLEVAPRGWSGAANDPVRRWANTANENSMFGFYPDGNSMDPDKFGIGGGYENTRKIIAQGNNDPTTIAAALADSHTSTVSGVVYDDWYLPSGGELNQMCKWQKGETAARSSAQITDLDFVCDRGFPDLIINSAVLGAQDAGFVEGMASQLAGAFWSSNRLGTNSARAIDWLVGGYVENPKSSNGQVRPIRAFP